MNAFQIVMIVIAFFGNLFGLADIRRGLQLKRASLITPKIFWSILAFDIFVMISCNSLIYAVF